MNVVGCGRCKEDACAHDIIGSAPTACWDTIQNCFATVCISAQCCCVVCCHVAWSNGVYVDAVLSPFVGHTHCDTLDSGFACCVTWYADTTLVTEHACYGNDLSATALLDELTSNRLAKEENCFCVNCHNFVPVFFGKVDSIFAQNDTSVVNQNVHMTENFHSFSDDAIDWLKSHQVFYHVLEVICAQHILSCLAGNHAYTHNFGACLHKCFAETLSKTCVTTCYDGYFTF